MKKIEIDGVEYSLLKIRKGSNAHGLDVHYFSNLFARELCDLSNYTPDELARVLMRAALVADSEILNESEFKVVSKNTEEPKTVDLSPLVGSGIDCEFSSDDVWCLIGGVKDMVDGIYFSSNGIRSLHCRPRLNHPMVLDSNQLSILESIEGLKYDYEFIYKLGLYIAEITGLQDGYKWP